MSTPVTLIGEYPPGLWCEAYTFNVVCYEDNYFPAVCKYRKFAVETEISKFVIFSQKKDLGETFSKITIKASKDFFFFSRKTSKKWNPAPRHIVAGPYSRRSKPLNYTIFKALGEKEGSRKQVHLWQVNKASQLLYYLVKILQENEVFTRLKKPEDSYRQHFHKQWNFAKLWRKKSQLGVTYGRNCE